MEESVIIKKQMKTFLNFQEKTKIFLKVLKCHYSINWLLEILQNNTWSQSLLRKKLRVYCNSYMRQNLRVRCSLNFEFGTFNAMKCIFIFFSRKQGNTTRRSRTSAIKLCCCADQATDKQLVWIAYSTEYLIWNSGNAALLTFYFPGTMLHNFSPYVHTHYSE